MRTIGKTWSVGWGMTSLCNLTCQHCYNRSGRCAPPGELKEAEIWGVVRTLCESDIRSVNYGTGESGLLDCFWEVVRYVHEHSDITQGLTTNGLSVGPATIETVKECLNDVDVSIDFPDRARHEALRGPGAWKQATRALGLLQEHDVERGVVTCLHSCNCDTDTLRGLLDLSREYGASFRVNVFRQVGRGSEYEALKPTVEQVHDAMRWLFINAKVIALPDTYFAAILGEKANGCPCGERSLRVTPTGKVVPCVYLGGLPGRSVVDSPLDEVVRADSFIEMASRNPGFCQGCAHYETCRGGCASRAYLEHGSMDAPDGLCYIKAGMSNPLEGVRVQFASREPVVHEDYLCTVIFEP